MRMPKKIRTPKRIQKTEEYQSMRRKYGSLLYSLVEEAQKSDRYAEIGDIEQVSLAALDEVLTSALAKVRFLASHQHEWTCHDNDPAYCSICGCVEA